MVAVVFGGHHDTHEASLRSGQHVATLLESAESPVAEVKRIFVDKNGQWFERGVSKEPKRHLRDVSVVWNGLLKESQAGHIQKLLEPFRTPVTGSSAYTARVTSNTGSFNRVAKRHGINSRKHYKIHKDMTGDMFEQVTQSLRFPVRVQGMASEHSVQVLIAHNTDELLDITAGVFRRRNSYTVQEVMPGRRITVAYVERYRNQSHYLGLPIELDLDHHDAEVFSHYHDEIDSSRLARLSSRINNQITTQTQRIAQVFHIRHNALVTFILKDNGDVVVDRVETHPRTSRDSVFWQSLEAAGSQPSGVTAHIVRLCASG